jgi:hypothetical protein
MSKDKSKPQEPQGELPEVFPVRTLSVHLLNTGGFAMEFPKNDDADFNTALFFLTQGLGIINQEIARAKTLNTGRIVKPNLVLPGNFRPRS